MNNRSNLNLFNAIKIMRIARKLGKISLEQQQRLIRRLAPRESTLRWERMMALRASIEKAITPALQAKRAVEFEVFDIKHSTTPVRKALPVFTGKVKAPIIETLDANWWKEAGKRDKASRKDSDEDGE